MDYHIRGRDLGQACVQVLRSALGAGTTAYIVGKGPSLDHLTEEDFSEFPGAPVICVNEAIHIVERLEVEASRLFCIQHDPIPENPPPSRGTRLLASYSWDQVEDHSRDIQYSLADICDHNPNISAGTAISMLSLAGATTAVMLAFDAEFTGACEYAKGIGKTHIKDGQPSDRFIQYATKDLPRRAAEEGMRLIWQAPKDFWMVGLVLRSGGAYNMGHVRNMEWQMRHLTNPHKTVLLTDKWDARAWRRVPLATDWPGWFAKLELFRPDINLRGGILYTDLDNYFGRPFTLPGWDTLRPGALHATVDPYRPMWMSSLMAWRAGSVTSPYTSFLRRPVTAHPSNVIYGDQEVINSAVGQDIEYLSMMEARSWKKDHPDPTEVDCVLFHGQPKPWDVNLVPIPEEEI